MLRAVGFKVGILGLGWRGLAKGPVHGNHHALCSFGIIAQLSAAVPVDQFVVRWVAFTCSADPRHLRVRAHHVTTVFLYSRSGGKPSHLRLVVAVLADRTAPVLLLLLLLLFLALLLLLLAVATSACLQCQWQQPSHES